MRAFGEGADALPRELRLKLANKFLSFCEARASIRRRMESYVLDYQLHDAGAAHKYERLEEQYSADRPDLSRLSPNEEGTMLWSMRDIAIVLGRNVSSVMRTLRRMENSLNWGERLNGLTHRRDNPGRSAATLYAGGIFDAVVDFYEDAYVARVTHPRHGAPLSEAHILAIRAFWRWLRENPDGLDWREYTRSLSLTSGPSPSAAALYQGLRLIVKRAFSIKMGTFFLALFALIYELSGLWLWFNFVLPFLSLCALAFVLHQMPRGRWYTPWLVDAGACALTFTLLWGLAVVVALDAPQKPMWRFLEGLPRREAHQESIPPSSNAAVFGITPTLSTAKAGWDKGGEVSDMRLELSYIREGIATFYVYTGEEPREIFYRVSPDRDFRSAGFSSERNPVTKERYAQHTIDLKEWPRYELEVKYADQGGGMHGPQTFGVDLHEEFMEEVRKALDYVDWVTFSKGRKTDIQLDVFRELWPLGAGWNVIDKIAYGVNKKSPNRVRERPKPDKELPVADIADRFLAVETKEKVWFISMQIFFSDGTSTDVRVFENPYADL